MSDKYILVGREVEEATELEWAEWRNRRRTNTDWIVGKTDLRNCHISTVFVGFGGKYPEIFETLVSGGPNDGKLVHYSTWQEAEEGHKRMIELCELANPNDYA